MIKLKIAGKEYQICSTWEEVTFGQYIDILDIQMDKYNDLDKAVNIIAALSNDKQSCVKDLYSLTAAQLASLQDYFEWYRQNIDVFLNSETQEYFEIDGKKFTIKSHYDKLTVGELVSVDVVLKKNKNLHPFEVGFGVLFRELDENGKEKEFSEEGFIEVLTKIRDKVRFIDVYKHINFFLSGKENLSKSDTEGFSVEQM